MGSVFATLAFQVFSSMWSVYEKTHGKKTGKSKREVELENLLKKQNALIAKARLYCDFCDGKVKAQEAEIKRLGSLVDALGKAHGVPANPY